MAAAGSYEPSPESPPPSLTSSTSLTCSLRCFSKRPTQRWTLLTATTLTLWACCRGPLHSEARSRWTPCPGTSSPLVHKSFREFRAEPSCQQRSSPAALVRLVFFLDIVFNRCSGPSIDFSHYVGLEQEVVPFSCGSFCWSFSDRSCQSCISWTGDGWEFKLTDPDEVVTTS